MQSKAATVAAYLAELEPTARQALTVLRRRIRAAAPEADERMAHGMATYSTGDTLLFALAAQKQYLALYVCHPAAVARHGKSLGATSIGKSCIRFKRLDQLDLKAVEALLRDAAGGA